MQRKNVLSNDLVNRTNKLFYDYESIYGADISTISKDYSANRGRYYSVFDQFLEKREEKTVSNNINKRYNYQNSSKGSKKKGIGCLGCIIIIIIIAIIFGPSSSPKNSNDKTNASTYTPIQNTKTEFSIIKQPTNQTIVAGGAATFSITATGAISYQWQISTDGGKTWQNSNANGAQTNTITSYSVVNGLCYRCVVTSSAGKTLVSNTAVLTVTR